MIDSPESGSGRDFTYYLGTVNTSDDNKLNNEFKTELIKIYLTNGGDPNHRLPGRAGSPFFYYVALMENYDGIWVLLKAGANPLLYDNSGSINPLVTIALNYDDIFMAISPGGPTNIKREALYKKLAMRILKYHPDYPDNNYTQNIFNGPIPWMTKIYVNEGSSKRKACIKVNTMQVK